MQDCVFCRTTDKGEQTFYLVKDNKKYMLFIQAFRRSLKDIFSNGVNLKELNRYKGHESYSVRKVITKIPLYIKYIEDEYGVNIYVDSKKKYYIRNQIKNVYDNCEEDIIC